MRKLCECKEAYVPAKESIESIKKMLSIISPKAKMEIPKDITKLYRPKGCVKCNNLGYKGRIGIFEVLTINEEIEKLILEMAGETELAVAALEVRNDYDASGRNFESHQMESLPLTKLSALPDKENFWKKFMKN